MRPLRHLGRAADRLDAAFGCPPGGADSPARGAAQIQTKSSETPPPVRTDRMPRLGIVFFGTAEFACPSLAALHEDSGMNVLAVVTQPDRPGGRDLRPQPSPIKQWASLRGLTILQPERAKTPEFCQSMAALAPDLIVVAAYGQILRRNLLELPRWGCLNVHGSLLPKYRGAAPIQWAMLEDEPETGITIMKMDEGLDTGPVLAKENTPILPSDTGQILHDRLARIGAGLLIRTIPQYVAGAVQPVPQPSEGATYTRKIKKEDGCIDWNVGARVLWNRVRALNPWPGTFTHYAAHGTRKLLKVWSAEIIEGASGAPGKILGVSAEGIVAACGTGALRLTVLQREGGKRLPAADFLLGNPLRPGDVLGELASGAGQIS